jgi:hypothetical protein
MLATFFFSHAYHFFFQPGHGSQWYEGNVFGNLVAIIPSGVLLWLYLRSRHLAVLEAHQALRIAHVSHAEKLDKILEHLDPEAATDGMLDVIADRVDLDSPGGLQVLAERLEGLSHRVDSQAHANAQRAKALPKPSHHETHPH